jgi:hypothetical protein
MRFPAPQHCFYATEFAASTLMAKLNRLHHFLNWLKETVTIEYIVLHFTIFINENDEMIEDFDDDVI